MDGLILLGTPPPPPTPLGTPRYRAPPFHMPFCDFYLSRTLLTHLGEGMMLLGMPPRYMAPPRVSLSMSAGVVVRVELMA